MSYISPEYADDGGGPLVSIPENTPYDNLKSITLPLTSPIPTHHHHTNQHHIQTPPSSETPVKYIHTAPINFPSPTTTITPAIPIDAPLGRASPRGPVVAGLDPTSTTSYASFEITSGSISQSPYYSSVLLSPHNPPYEPDLYSPHRHHHPPPPQQLALGGFNSFVEDRYSRFRPLDSQHNNDGVMSGMHPFQQENYGMPKKNILVAFSNWFKPRRTPRLTVVGAPVGDGEGDGEGEGEGEKSSSEDTIVISQEPNDNTPQPVYTPRGIPINEFPLNFNKENTEENSARRGGHNEDIIDSFDDDVRDLINGVDNFLISCLGGAWDLAKSTSDYCMTLCV
ncbi:hypothetical protein Cantr_04781 [Candida viswanathii]|uniref:Uncharacterized protein n=1 Tax=Candida viswanathii TaxID=5486 RepID=A0A367XLW8_9ASCO|nr:hypothetical protein Cantr_04781 [Candida viswanathii]